MSPTTGTIRHPDVSEISDLAEGLLSPSRTAEVRSHLGDCALCADVRASLEEIRALLGTLPGHPRMPVDIAGRIDAALAAEALLDATTPAPGPAPAEHGRQSAPKDVEADDVSRETSAAAPARSGGTGGLRPSGHPTGSTGPGRRRARRRIAALGALAAACALGIFLATGLHDTSTSHDTAARADATSPLAKPRGPAYTAQGLQDIVRDLLGPGQRPKTPPGEQNNTYGMENTTPAPGVAPGDRGAASVPECVQEGTGRADTPLATDRGTYERKDVYLLVLAHPGDPGLVDAYLVDAACENGPSTAPGKPLLSSTYPRS
ncbi:hypothetical protein ACFWBF_29160 [Streptomyces sp. NPDC060028]|uniref:hypothetical protein n=1 Tax=Streptomyces sp. NPDC060028 TaxID=3347041 RepID=UPI0036B3B636